MKIQPSYLLSPIEKEKLRRIALGFIKKELANVIAVVIIAVVIITFFQRKSPHK